LKIDQTFVAEMGNSPEAAALIHTLVQLGKGLDLIIIAEGIETVAQQKSLRAESVDIGQGFLFSRPLHVEAMDRYLAQFSTYGIAPVSARSGGAEDH
jgi:EAL domain-containing protein (putative c-di-GMP-specific phosphodiesterase class I)